jgi:hypothetical protein
MRIALVHAVRQQYGFACGYCAVSEVDAGTTLTIDHFQPRSQGGTDDFSNLVYACHACNQHKGDYWSPDTTERLLHPLMEDVTLHYTEQNDGTLLALTQTGQFHITRLQLNRSALITRRFRQHLLREEQQERRESLATIEEVLRLVQEINAAIQQRRSGGE